MPAPTHLVDKENDKKYRVNGYQPSKRLPKKENLHKEFSTEVKFTSEDELPKGGVDLRPMMTPVQNQASIASCTANTIAAIYGYLLKTENPKDKDVSRLFVYYNARLKKNPKKVEDHGVSMTNTIEALEEQGACHDEFWPYDVKKVNERPKKDAYEEGKKHTITEAFQVKADLFEMKACLAQGLPFAFGTTLYQSFDQAKKKGVVAMPTPGEPTRKSHGAHAMLAVGYNEKEQVFIVRNSWSEEWGDKGNCYIPYKYMADKYNCYDRWTVRRLKSDHLSRKGWKEDPDWSPCVFSYKEELHRVETFHYEEEIFIIIPEHERRTRVSGGDHSEDEETDQVHDGDEPSLSSTHDEPEEDEERRDAGGMISSEPVDDDGGDDDAEEPQEPAGDGGMMSSYGFADGGEQQEESADDGGVMFAPGFGEGGAPQVEAADASADMMFTSGFADDGEQQFANPWEQNDQFGDEE